jgi:hypothetical protein
MPGCEKDEGTEEQRREASKFIFYTHRSKGKQMKDGQDMGKKEAFKQF